MTTTDYQVMTETKLKRIPCLSSQDKGKSFNNLMHLFNEDALTVCYHELDANKAMRVYGVSKVKHGLKLTENIKELVNKLKSIRSFAVSKIGYQLEAHRINVRLNLRRVEKV